MADMNLQAVIELTDRGFGSGLRQAETRLQRFQKIAGALGPTMMGIGAGLLGAGGAMMVGINRVADLGNRLYDLHQRTGMSVEALSSMSYMAEATGADLNDLARAAIYLQKNAGAALPATEKLFRSIGVATRDATGQLKPAEVLFNETTMALRAIPDEAERTSIAMRLMGRGAMMMLPVFSMANDEFDRMQQIGQDIRWSEAQAEAADAWDDALTKLRLSMTGLLRDSLVPLLNELKPLIFQLADAAKAAGEFAAKHPGIAKFALAFGAVNLVLGAGITAWGRLGTVLNTVIGAFARTKVAAEAAAAASVLGGGGGGRGPMVMGGYGPVGAGAAGAAGAGAAGAAAGGLKAGLVGIATKGLWVVAILEAVATVIAAYQEVEKGAKKGGFVGGLKAGGLMAILGNLYGARKLGEWFGLKKTELPWEHRADAEQKMGWFGRPKPTLRSEEEAKAGGRKGAMPRGGADSGIISSGRAGFLAEQAQELALGEQKAFADAWSQYADEQIAAAQAAVAEAGENTQEIATASLKLAQTYEWQAALLTRVGSDKEATQALSKAAKERQKVFNDALTQRTSLAEVEVQLAEMDSQTITPALLSAEQKYIAALRGQEQALMQEGAYLEARQTELKIKQKLAAFKEKYGADLEAQTAQLPPMPAVLPPGMSFTADARAHPENYFATPRGMRPTEQLPPGTYRTPGGLVQVTINFHGSTYGDADLERRVKEYTAMGIRQAGLVPSY